MSLTHTPVSATIIIINYNYDQYLRAAIDSGLGQTCPSQVVVVDDASTDGSPATIQSYRDRIVAVLQPTNGGQAAAMNAGIALATGDVVIFLDSDDYLAPTAVETVLRRWRPGTAIAQYPLTIVDAADREVGVYPDPPTGLSDGDVRPLLLATGGYVAMVTSGLAFARSVLADVMPIPTAPFRQAADGYLTRAAAFHGNVQRIEERLGFYRQHGRNDSDVTSTTGGLAAGFRKKIRYARNEFDATRQLAAKSGYSVPPDLGEASADYVGYRLFSFILAPAEHPIAGDSRVALLPRYVAARWRSAYSLRRKVIAILCAIAASFSPRGLAETFVRWLHDPSSRPPWLRSRGSRSG